MNPTSKDETATVETATEKDGANDASAKEVRQENVQESDAQEEIVNGHQSEHRSAEEDNGAESSPNAPRTPYDSNNEDSAKKVKTYGYQRQQADM